MTTKIGRSSVALVRSWPTPLWKSCQSIVANLERAYLSIDGLRPARFDLPLWEGAKGVWDTAVAIRERRPEKIVLIEHSFRSAELLQALVEAYGTSTLPPVYVHLYGDFARLAEGWRAAAPALRRLKLLFLCSSERQLLLVRDFLGSSANAELCPFPVDCSGFFADPMARRRWRSRLLRTDERLIVYTGRLSQQKNSIRLIEEFSSWQARRRHPARLALAGTFDDFDATGQGFGRGRHWYYQEWLRSYERLSAASRERIAFLGNLSVGDLRGLYNAADAYLSLSLYHEEDFGMAPAEALCCGTPVTLTDWGGYGEFCHSFSGCGAIPVRLDGKEPALRSAEVQTALDGLWERQSQALRRNDLAAGARSRFSIEAVADRLEEILAGEIQSFTGYRGGNLTRRSVYEAYVSELR